MGPEQFAGEKLDRRADIYAMGCLLWDAAAGQRMWGRKGDVEIWKRVVHGVIPSPSTVNADVPPALEAIVMRALAKKREDRYPTCLDLKRELDAFLETRERKASLKEIGAYVGELFHEQREERRITIAERLAAAAPEDRVTPSETTSLPRLTYAPKRSDAPESARGEHALAKSLPARPGRRSIGVAISAIAIGAVLASAGLARREAPTEATASGAEAPRDVSVRIEASPAGAKLYLDDAPLDANPSMGQRPRDALAHRIRGEAPGFAPQAITVTFDRDIDVVLALERVANPPK
jgi:serine/threonine-protein kinase